MITMNYEKFLTERYIKTGRKGYTIYDEIYLTDRNLQKQGFEAIGGYSEHAANIYKRQENPPPETGNKPGCYGDYTGELQINQIALEIGDPLNEHVVGGWWNRKIIPFSRKVVFEKKSMDVDEIEKAYMWFESFKVYHRYNDITETFHDLLYSKLIETGKYKTRDFKKEIFD